MGISFWSYLNDHLRGRDRIPALPRPIEARAQAPWRQAAAAPALAAIAGLRCGSDATLARVAGPRSPSACERPSWPLIVHPLPQLFEK